MSTHIPNITNDSIRYFILILSMTLNGIYLRANIIWVIVTLNSARTVENAAPFEKTEVYL